jgi:pyruvate/2-oxoglutarate dehydrogenase complex dihydrolipoamide acyltransferase (E2) component
MISKLFIPKLGMTMEKATVAEWRYRHGDRVEKDAAVLVIDTEKVANELEAPAAGRLVIAAKPGQELPCGAVVGFIAETEEEFAEAERQAEVEGPAGGAALAASSSVGEPAAQTAEAAGGATSERVKISPLARKLAAEKGIDVRSVKGSGPGGRVLREDIEAAAKAGATRRERVEAGAAAAAVAVHGSKAITVTGSGAPIARSDADTPRSYAVLAQPEGGHGAAPAIRPAGARPGGKQVREAIPLKGIRKVISEHMQLSHSVSAPVSVISEVDMTEAIRFRDRLNARGASSGASITFTDIFIMVTAKALRRVPIMNSSLVGNEIVVWDVVNVGCAVSIQVDEGRNALVVPVIHDADRLPLREIAARRKDVTDRARAGRLTVDDTAGGTFTITNTGTLGPMWHFQTPIINQPEAAILGTASIVDRAVVVDGSIVARPIMPVAVTFDHRIMDGAPPAQFLGHVHEMLVDPQMMLA